VIRRAEEKDLPGILEVLSLYNFKVLNPVDGAAVDDGCGDVLKLYNEVSVLDLQDGFVAIHEKSIIGSSHFKILDRDTAKTTLISVDPHFSGHQYGKALQTSRMERAYASGCKKMITYCDNPRACGWYSRYFGYRIIDTEVNHHRLHVIPTSAGAVWGVHYGFYENDTVSILETDLHQFFRKA